MTFSQQAWGAIAPIRAAVETLPFLRELEAGSLSEDRFRQYMIQDALYLAAYSRALALASAKAPDLDGMAFFSKAAQTALIVEQALHRSFFTRYGISDAAAAEAEPSPTCLAYTSFLLATAQTDSYAVLLAAILPCYWIYKDAGDRIAVAAAPANPYQPWIDTYSDADFAAATEQAILMTDRAAEAADDMTQTRMHRAFVRSSQYEWMFWDSAYRLEDWPV